MDVTTSALNFGTVNLGQTSTTQNVSVYNVGNVSLNFSPSDAFTAPPPFTLPNNNCATQPSSLAAGATCIFGVAFAPTAVGNLSGTLTISDNAFVTPQYVQLSGTGFQPQVATNTALSAAPTSTSYGQQITLTVSVNAVQLNNASPTGTVTFSAGSTQLGQASMTAVANSNTAQATLTVSGTLLPAGTYNIVAAYSGDSNYLSSSGTLIFTVNPATPGITWAEPGAVIYGTALTSSQLDATANVAGTFAYTPAAGTVLGAGSQTLSVMFTPSDTMDYTTATAAVMLLVRQATPVVTWTPPAAITYGTPLSITQLNATASVPGTFVYTPAAGTVLGAGSQTLSVMFTPTDTTDYTTATATATLTISKAQPTVTFTGAPASGVYGSTFSVAATTNASTTPLITASGACSITNMMVTMISGTGTCTLSANWASDNNYVAATAGQSTLAVKAASTTGITSNTPNPSAPGHPVLVAFTVAGNGSPSGNVVVTASTGELCTGTLAASAGSCSLTFVTVGSRTLIATYSGDLNFNGGASAAVAQSVVGPLARLTPATVNFGNVYLGFPALQSVTLTNVGNASMLVGKVQVSGGNDSDDFIPASFCPGTLAAGKSCQILIGFLADADNYAPTAVLSINDNALGSPQTVSLSATVINPQASLSSYGLNFGKETVGSTSAAQTVTLTNTGTTPLVLSGLTASGDFTLASGTGCETGSSLAAGAHCSIDVTFTPTAEGPRSGSIRVKDNALARATAGGPFARNWHLGSVK